MTDPVRIAVIDIGKTNAKVVLFDLAEGREIAERRMANQPLPGPPCRHFDVEALADFIFRSLAELHRLHGIEAISITTHGACFAALDETGALALPVMDYEDPAPDDLSADYEALRPDFAETGSPRLPMGLNAAAMLFWQMKTMPEAFAKVRWILPWPQYWAFRLTGVLASEATSLGVHTDLWNPHRGDFSSLVDRLGWRRLMPEIRPAADVLGCLHADLARRHGLPETIKVHSGIHDSNASLLPHLLTREAPFAVMSTGTWVVTLAVGGADIALDERRDSLFNVNAQGQKTPSARFMGGRAFDMLVRDPGAEVTAADRSRVLEEQIMVLPSIPTGSGPFPQAKGLWSAKPGTDGERLYAASLYLALMSKVTLDLTGARGDCVVEGPFAANPHFLDMLAALTGRRPIASAGRATGTSYGAACLALGTRQLASAETAEAFEAPDPALIRYGARWNEIIATLSRRQAP